MVLLSTINWTVPPHHSGFKTPYPVCLYCRSWYTFLENSLLLHHMRLTHSNHYERITVLKLSGVGAEDFNFLASDSNRSLESAKLLYHDQTRPGKLCICLADTARCRLRLTFCSLPWRAPAVPTPPCLTESKKMNPPRSPYTSF